MTRTCCAALVAAVALALGACDGSDGDPPSARGAEGIPGQSSDAEPALVGVYVQAPSHPARVYARISGVGVDGDDLVLEVGLSNANRDTRGFNHHGTSLEDSQGRRYPLRPPTDNEDMAIPARSLLEGTLRFVGAAGAPGPYTVTFNDGSAGPRPGGDSLASHDPLIQVTGIPAPDAD